MGIKAVLRTIQGSAEGLFYGDVEARAREQLRWVERHGSRIAGAMLVRSAELMAGVAPRAPAAARPGLHHLPAPEHLDDALDDLAEADELTCAVSLSRLTTACALPCQHKFNRESLETLDSCPLCRHPFHSDDVRDDIATRARVAALQDDPRLPAVLARYPSREPVGGRPVPACLTGTIAQRIGATDGTHLGLQPAQYAALLQDCAGRLQRPPLSSGSWPATATAVTQHMARQLDRCGVLPPPQGLSRPDVHAFWQTAPWDEVQESAFARLLRANVPV